MYSSRMRTARLLPVSPSMHCSQGGYFVGECTCLGVYLPGGVPAWGVPSGGGVGTCPGGYLPSYSHPSVNRMTDRQV